MAVLIRPDNFEQSEVVLASSDAADNDAAIREIDAWTRAHGFVRSRERQLNARLTADGRALYDSACYRWTEDHRRAAEGVLAQIRARRAKMPVTASSDLLAREDA